MHSPSNRVIDQCVWLRCVIIECLRFYYSDVDQCVIIEYLVKML